MVNKTKVTNLILVFVFSLIAISYFIKLDYESYFTDEILYLNSGREYLQKNDYTLNLQHPFVAKYLVGMASLVDERNVIVLRFPFALLGVLSCFVVYKILIDHTNRKIFALSGAILYATSFYLFQTHRMSMMESPMHLFWLLTSFFFFRYLKSPNVKFVLLTGAMLGLSLASKFTALTIMAPMVVTALFYVYTKKEPVKKYLNILLIPLAALLSFAATYFHLFIIKGFTGFTDILRAVKDTILERNSDGKIHVIGGQVYSKSPWWFYLYYIKENYGTAQKIVTIFPFLSFLVSRDYFSVYWFSFFITNLLLFMFMSLKNARYIASMELPLIFLSVLFLKFIYEKISRRAFILILGILILSQAAYLGSMQRTGYSALYKYISEQTLGFYNTERVYILGSIRSSRWYFEGAPEDRIVSRKDFDVMAPEFPNFKYIVIEDTEEIKNPDNELSMYVRTNEQNYNKLIFTGLKVYVKK